MIFKERCSISGKTVHNNQAMIRNQNITCSFEHPKTHLVQQVLL